MRTKQELLDLLEQNALLIGGEIVMATKVGLTPDFVKMEEALGEMIDATLDLKQLEDIPSKLTRVDRSDRQG